MSSAKQPKENKAKAICKEKVTSDNSEVCIGVFFVCLFSFFLHFLVMPSCHLLHNLDYNERCQSF